MRHEVFEAVRAPSLVLGVTVFRCELRCSAGSIEARKVSAGKAGGSTAETAAAVALAVAVEDDLARAAAKAFVKASFRLAAAAAAAAGPSTRAQARGGPPSPARLATCASRC